MDILVSIIIPIYNAECYLERCLNSVINQTYKNIEIILINDGSKDNSINICKKYRSNDERVVIINQDNFGVSYSRNIGINHAKGKYILFVDADDSIDINMVENMLKLATKYNGDCIICNYDDGKNNYKQPNEEIEQIFTDEAIKRFLIHNSLKGMLWNKLIKRKYFENNMFDTTVGYAEDAQVVWKLIKKMNSIVITSHTYYHHYINDDSISNKKFSANKFSEIKVWSDILLDVEANYREYMNIIYARYGSVCTFMLYDMYKNRYIDNDRENEIKHEINKYFKYIIFNNQISIKTKLFAIFVKLKLVNIIKIML